MTRQINRRAAVTVVGLGDDGCASLTPRAHGAIAAATVLAGGERHLAFFPEFAGERVVLEKGLGATLDRLAARAGEETIVIMHNDAVIQGLSDYGNSRDSKHWAVLTIGTGLGNARFTNRELDD